MTLTFMLFLMSSVACADDDSAMEVKDFYHPETKDIFTLIKNPTQGGGVRISASSDENGVCKALGYQRAIVDMLKSGIYESPMVYVDQNGVIAGGVQTGRSINEINCVNKVGEQKEKTLQFINPSYSRINAMFSIYSDQNGVCKAFGLQRAAMGTMNYLGNYFGPTVIADKNGTITEGRRVGPKIGSIICVDLVP